MNFTLHQLNLFCTVVEVKNITKAAEKLDLTQPAVSIQLKKFQENFELPIIELIGKKIKITDFGMQLYEHSQRILENVDQVRFAMDAFRGGVSGKLKISSVSTGKYILPFYLRSFLLEHKNVELKMDVSNRDQVLNDLSSGKIEIALVTLKPYDLDVEEEFLMKNPMRLVGQKDNFNKDKTKSVKNFPLIFREEGSGTRIAMQRHFERIHFKPSIKLELTSNEAVKQAVIAGLGYSILPLVSLRNELAQNEVEVIKDEKMKVKSEWSLIWPKNRKLSPVSQAFIEHVRAHKDEIYKKKFSWLDEFND